MVRSTALCISCLHFVWTINVLLSPERMYEWTQWRYMAKDSALWGAQTHRVKKAAWGQELYTMWLKMHAFGSGVKESSVKVRIRVRWVHDNEGLQYCLKLSCFKTWMLVVSWHTSECINRYCCPCLFVRAAQEHIYDVRTYNIRNCYKVHTSVTPELIACSFTSCCVWIWIFSTMHRLVR